MAISSLLDIAWDHAYWTEGPEFTATPLTGSSGRFSGVSSRGGEAHVSSWPDEVGTADASTAAGTANQPFYTSSSADLNGKPTVFLKSTEGIDRHLRASFSTLTPPLDIVVIGRCNALGGFYFFDNSTSARFRFGTLTTGGADVINKWVLDFGGTTRYGSASDTTGHLFRIRADISDSLFVDEVSDIAANAGASTLDGLTFFDTFGLSGPLKGEIAFIGVKDTVLTSTEISDLHSYAQSHYGTP